MTPPLTPRQCQPTDRLYWDEDPEDRGVMGAGDGQFAVAAHTRTVARESSL
jgi:hypothetical protein